MPLTLKRLAARARSSPEDPAATTSKLDSAMTSNKSNRKSSLLQRVLGSYYYKKQQRPMSRHTIETSCLQTSQSNGDNADDDKKHPSLYRVTTKSSYNRCSALLTVPLEVILIENEHDGSSSDDETYWENLEVIEGGEVSEPSAEVCYITALDCVEDNEMELALEEIQKGMDLSPDSETYCKLLRVHAQVLVHMRRYQEALTIYQTLLDASVTITDRANILYSCGQIASRIKDYERALGFFQQELHMLSCNPTLAARIYREVAIIYKQAYGDLDKAMYYYQQARTAESFVYKTLLAENIDDNKRSSSAKKIQDILNQMRETKECIGRIYYEQGDLSKAVRFAIT